MKPIEAITQEVLQDRAELVRSLSAVLERTKPGTPLFKKLTQELTDILNPTSDRNLGHVAVKAVNAITPRYVAISVALVVGAVTTAGLYNRYRRTRHA